MPRRAVVGGEFQVAVPPVKISDRRLPKRAERSNRWSPWKGIELSIVWSADHCPLRDLVAYSMVRGRIVIDQVRHALGIDGDAVAVARIADQGLIGGRCGGAADGHVDGVQDVEPPRRSAAW